MRQLIHNGVLVPKYEWKGLSISVKGRRVQLTPKQEEMAVAWVKKMGTEHAEDRVFIRNFFRDFCVALGIDGKADPGDFDFSEVIDYVEREKAWKESLTKEEKRRMREERRAVREANKEKYGYAIVDGVRMEISNYIAEPSCIFIGRGKHPKRGRWKEGPTEEDIELNLSPDAPRPPGNWKRIVWEPDVMWIARWRDKLSGKMKYVWLSENTKLKQMREIEKFNKAIELRRNIERIKRHINENLDADDLIRRKTATVCYLIDRLKIRVGDEKDPEEADTVGASTLRPEHIKFEDDGTVIFNFLGKDSVPHIFKVRLPEIVIRNLKEFSADAESTIFEGVNSKRVSEFLDEVVRGLSAKVFRTYYASEAVERKLESTPVEREDPDYVKKYVATLANLEAAKVCNHRRKIPKTWRTMLERRKERLRVRMERFKEAEGRIKRRIKESRERYIKRLRKYEGRIEALKDRLRDLQRQLAEREKEGRSTKTLRKRISTARKGIKRQRMLIKRLKERHREGLRRLRERLARLEQRRRAAIEKERLQIKIRMETRDYNLSTSLKSYIDPRIYYRWGRRVDFDWKLYYPKSLRRKFSWVEDPLMSVGEKPLTAGDLPVGDGAEE
ncbi:MAG: 2-alkenal reductase [Candidatus Bathyarchaeota archaeon B63]|nr:MAG: 2-alkenal reductase [Candidatus Bathyarchaeota archaeon B63]